MRERGGRREEGGRSKGGGRYKERGRERVREEEEREGVKGKTGAYIREGEGDFCKHPELSSMSCIYAYMYIQAQTLVAHGSSPS